jgi:tetratricopeptide (TPR) repeat protein
MGRVEKTVFISYRRTNLPWAVAIFQNLKRHGYDVFIDFKGIASGSFERVILENIRARAHFIVLLTPSALNRCSDPGDWLRREIETAIDLQRNIVPVFLKGFSYKTPQIANQLTGKLATLKGYNGLSIPSDYFDEAMSRLRKAFLNVSLDTILQPASAAAALASSDDQEAADAAPNVTEEELTAQEWFERGCSSSSAREKMRCWNEVIRLDPAFGLAYYNRAGALSDNGEYQSALEDYNQAVRLMPEDPSSLVYRGITRKDIGDAAGAQEDFIAACLLAPEATRKFLIEKGYWQVPIPDDLKEALKDPDENVRRKAGEALLCWQTAFHFGMDDDLDIGLRLNLQQRALTEAIDFFPSFAAAYHERAQVRQAKGEYKEALPDYNKAIRLNPGNAEAFCDRGWLRWQHRRNDLAAAIRDFDEAIRIKPYSSRFFSYRGQARRDKGDFKGARADFDEAIRIKPDGADAYYQRALTLKRMGHRAAAISDLETYLDRDRTKGYRDYKEEQRARDLIRDLKKKK